MKTRNTQQRNFVVLNPLLKKGGAHQKGNSSQRANERHRINSYLDEWYEEQTKGERKEESNDSSFAFSGLVLISILRYSPVV